MGQCSQVQIGLGQVIGYPNHWMFNTKLGYNPWFPSFFFNIGTPLESLEHHFSVATKLTKFGEATIREQTSVHHSHARTALPEEVRARDHLRVSMCSPLTSCTTSRTKDRRLHPVEA